MNYELRLRAIEPEDAEFMYIAESDEAAWKYSDYLAPLSLEMLRNYALTYDADPLRAGQLRLIVETGRQIAGILDIFDISPRHLRAETGIYLLPQFRGKGLATKVLAMAGDYCRSRLGLHQLTATVAQGNARALRCFEKAGFSITGSRPDWLRTPYGFEDVWLLTLTIDN